VPLPPHAHELNSFCSVAHRRVVDTHPFTARLMRRDAAFHAWHHEIFDPDVRERAAHHHTVVAAARAVAVELLDGHAELLQIKAGWRCRLNGAGRADVVGGNRIAKDREGARLVNW